MHSKLSTERQLKKYSLQHVMSTCGNYRKTFDDLKVSHATDETNPVFVVIVTI